MVPDRIAALLNKYQSFENFQDFVNIWAMDNECEMAVWCREIGDVNMSEGRRQFTDLIREVHDLARVVHFHIGFMVTYRLRLQWTHYCAMNSAEAAKMWLEDATLTDDQDLILERSFRDPLNGAPLYCKAIDTGRLVRKKDPNNPKVFNENSNIVQGILAGSLDGFLESMETNNGHYT